MTANEKPTVDSDLKPCPGGGFAIGRGQAPNYVTCPMCGNSVGWHTLHRAENGEQIVDMYDHPATQLPLPVNRILWNARDDDIDEIVLNDVKLVHVEQMTDRCWWVGIDLVNGGYWAGNFVADSRGRMRFIEQEQSDFTWDRDDEHMGRG